MNKNRTKPLIEVTNLQKHFLIGKKRIKAVNNISFAIYKGEIFGLVGESGSGKTTLAKTLLQLYTPTSGKFFFEEKEMFSLKEKELFPYRKKMQMIFQNPYSSLNPRMTVEKIISEPLHIHNLFPKREREEKIKTLLNQVALPSNCMTKYPHEFSGGERQRIAIARALASNPQFLLCDEILSSLDITIQRQIVDLLKGFQSDRKISTLFISHDLTLVSHLATRIGVMYFGNLVELGTKESITKKPLHPYTKALYASQLPPNPTEQNSYELKGEVPSFLHPPKGCAFCSRCEKAKSLCFRKKPIFEEKGPDHFAACHFID